MTPEERDLIAGLAERLRNADKNPAPKDREAEAFIRQIITEQPSAPYLLVQTVLVQEHALSNAQTRIAALERQVADLSARTRSGESEEKSGGVGSFLSGLLGGKSQTSSPTPTSGSASAQPRPPGATGASAPPPLPRQSAAADAPQTAPSSQQSYPSTMNMPPSAGGGFLRGALATAAGVAGGAMLFQGLQGLLGHNSGPFGGGGAGFGGGGFGGGGHLAGGQQNPLETGSHDTINNYYYGDQGGGSRDSGDVGGITSPEDDAERHSDMLLQSSEPVEDSGGGGSDDYRTAESGDFGNDDVTTGSDDLFANSGGGDSYDSGGGGDDSGGDFV